MVTAKNDVIASLKEGKLKAKKEKVKDGEFQGVDLSGVPRFISYKAALIQDKANLKIVLGVVVIASIALVGIYQHRIDQLHEALRKKEFLVVPFKLSRASKASPNTISDEFIISAIKGFSELTGTTTPTDVKKRHYKLASYMTPTLASRFLAESEGWVETARKEGLYDQIEHLDTKFVTTEEETIKGVSIFRRDRRRNAEYMGAVTEKLEIEMIVRQPKDDQEWSFEIIGYSRKNNNVGGKNE